MEKLKVWDKFSATAHVKAGGRQPLAKHLKRERIVHDLAEVEKHCSVCHQDLRPIGEGSSERYQYIPAQLTVIEDVCKKYACACTVKTGHQATAADRKEHCRCQSAGPGHRGQDRRSSAIAPAREDL